MMTDSFLFDILFDLERHRRVRLFRALFGGRKLREGILAVLDVRSEFPALFGGHPALAEEAVRDTLYGLDWSGILITLFIEFVLPLVLEWLRNRGPEQNAL